MRWLVALLMGCSLVRSADDIVVGSGDSAIDSTAIDSTTADTADAAESETTTEDRRWALWRMPSITPTGYTTMDDVVTDSVTRLEWQRTASGPVTYEAALAGCRAPWRLPYRVELISLLAIRDGSTPTIHTGVFPGTPAARFWTASTIAGGGRYVVSFETGNVEAALGTELYHYRCVR